MGIVIIKPENLMIGSQYFFMIRTPCAMISPAHEKRALRSLTREPRSFCAPDLLNRTRDDDAPEKRSAARHGAALLHIMPPKNQRHFSGISFDFIIVIEKLKPVHFLIIDRETYNFRNRRESP